MSVMLLTVSAWALANVYTAQEGEAGTRTANAVVVSDATASGSSAVKFGTNVAGGCPAYPAFPDANCTGWQHTGVTLQAVPGQKNEWHWLELGRLAV